MRSIRDVPKLMDDHFVTSSCILDLFSLVRVLISAWRWNIKLGHCHRGRGMVSSSPTHPENNIFTGVMGMNGVAVYLLFLSFQNSIVMVRVGRLRMARAVLSSRRTGYGCTLIEVHFECRYYPFKKNRSSDLMLRLYSVSNSVLESCRGIRTRSVCHSSPSISNWRFHRTYTY